MKRDLDLTARAGANVARVDIGWASLEEAGKGKRSRWYVRRLDHFMAAAKTRGIKVIATLVGSPCWASTAPRVLKRGCRGAWWERGVEIYPPRRATDYGDAARFIAKRYGSRLAALEIWNEPNLEDYFASRRPAADYARLVKAGYRGSKRGDRSVPVLAGSLAWSDVPFLEKLWRRGIRGHYDGISIHPYNEGRAPASTSPEEDEQYSFLHGPRSVHAAQRATGDETDLWLTEFGWSSCADGAWCVGESQQASYVKQAFELLESEPHVRAATVYNLRERGDDPVDREDNYGLVNLDFSPKPAYGALRSALREPRGARPSAFQSAIFTSLFGVVV